ncbi:MAG: succinate dehydrogenase flavoprotein subunit, partial [Exiguobacterium sp.]|nr:succinate dehydrogenase flavoprotein subunit [Exiguobacterium sp.]
REEIERFNNILAMDGTENAYQIHRELGELMTDNVTVVRYNDKLEATDKKIQELRERFHKISATDTARWSNQGASFIRQLDHMLDLARVITLGALKRDESRGAHYKPEFPERNDEQFMKTTMARYKDGEVDISYEDIDVSLIPPRKRDYSKKGAKTK